MPRSLWNGTVSVGLLNVPVKLYSATAPKSVRFHQVHLKDGARVEHKRFCSKEDAEVPYEEVAKGYEVAPGEYVALDPEEIKAAAGARTHVIDVDDFVALEQIDPVFFERPYYLGAGKDGAEAYRLLHDAMARTGRAALGRFVFHNREYLAAIRPLDGVLALHTMRFADEVVSAGDLEVAEPARAPSEREIEMAQRLVETLHEPFDPTAYRDEYRKAVLELIRRKAKGEAIAPPEAEEPEEPDDLLAALEASLGKGR